MYDISFVTDPEGNGDFWNKWKTMLAKQQAQLPAGQKFRLVCGGDVSGSRGSYSLRILQEIKTDVEQGQNWAALIAGNRDDNRLRFLTELANDDFVNGFYDNNNSQRCWLGNEISLPNDFPTNFKKLSIEKKRIYVAKWMLQYTMGSPAEFEQRLIELRDIIELAGADVTDQMVAQSFIEEMCDQDLLEKLFPGFDESQYVLPKAYRGLALWYIQNSSLYHVEQDALYAHSAMQAGDYPQELYSGNNLKELTVTDWVKHNNQMRMAAINDVLNHLKSSGSAKETVAVNRGGDQAIDAVNHYDNYCRKHNAIAASLPRHQDQRPHFRQSQNFLVDTYDKVDTDYTQLIILPPGIRYMFAGHQSVFIDYPLVLQVKNSDGDKGFIINCDTANPEKKAHYPNWACLKIMSNDGLLKQADTAAAKDNAGLKDDSQGVVDPSEILLSIDNSQATGSISKVEVASISNDVSYTLDAYTVEPELKALLGAKVTIISPGDGLQRTYHVSAVGFESDGNVYFLNAIQKGERFYSFNNQLVLPESNLIERLGSYGPLLSTSNAALYSSDRDNNNLDFSYEPVITKR